MKLRLIHFRRAMSRRSAASSRRGFVLPALLLLTVVVILFGLGRLVLFRHQTTLRINRQRELHHVLATRSAIRWLETHGLANNLPATTNTFFVTVPDADLTVRVCPALPVFPAAPEDFRIKRDADNLAAFANVYCSVYNDAARTVVPRWGLAADGSKELILGDDNTATGYTCRVEVDVPVASALWTSDVYGRRYVLGLNSVRGVGSLDGVEYDGDLIRFYLTPEGVSIDDAEYMVWLEKDHRDHAVNIPVRLGWLCGGVSDCTPTVEMNYQARAGMQVSGSMISMFEKLRNAISEEDGFTTHTFEPYELPLALVNHFKNIDGLRLTVEVLVRRPKLTDGGSLSVNAIGALIVEPAYEYFTEIEWPFGLNGYKAEVSTVIKYDTRVPRWGQGSTVEKAITYDTHGTAAKRRRW